MNRILFVLLVCGVFLATAVASDVAHAQSELSDAHLERIRQNCVTTRSMLDRLHVSDAGLRNNRGKLYEQISTKLMAPLNSRIALNRMGGLDLAATTLEYDRQLNTFRASYKQYEEAMSRTIRIDCTNKPVEFYDGVKSARELRQKLHADTKALTTLVQQYKTDFEEFAKEVEGAE